MQFFIDEFKSKGKECVFCSPKNQLILISTNNFNVLYDPFALVPGHLLIVSKQHYGCRGEVPTEHQMELSQLKERAVEILKGTFNCNILSYEHGRAGHCMSVDPTNRLCHHYHEHILPGEVDIHGILSKFYKGYEIQKEDLITEFFDSYGDYLYFDNGKGAKMFYATGKNHVAPHLLRTLIAEGFEAPERQNWEDYPDCNLMAEGMNRIQNYLEEKDKDSNAQVIYFDHSSTSHPKPKEMTEEIEKYVLNVGASPGRGGYSLSYLADEIITDTGKLLCDLLGVNNPQQLSFTHNATHAANIVLKGLLKSGDHVILSNFEHNAIFRPVHALYENHGVEYSIWESDREGTFDLALLKKMIRPNTKLISMNHASNVIGRISPVKEVCSIAQEYGIQTLVDLSQTCGLIPIEFANEADFLIGTGHKALLGPSGVGFLYVKNGDELKTLYEGGSGTNSLSKKHPSSLPDKFVAGTANYLGLAGLRGSLKYLQAVGCNEILKKSLSLAFKAENLLSQIPEVILYSPRNLVDRVPIVCFNILGFYANEASFLLDKHGICVRAGLHCAPLIHQTLGTAPHGTIRASFGHNNTEEQVYQFIEAVKFIIKGQNNEKISA